MNDQAKKQEVAIIDYQLSNLFSVKNACINAGLRPVITSDKQKILDADALILPGVGAFPSAMERLHKLDLVEPVKDYISSGRSFLGICLGLQLLFTESEEFGAKKGMGIIDGCVKPFIPNPSAGIKVPHMGWNHIHKSASNPGLWDMSSLSCIDDMSFMYFVHSFHVVPDNQKIIASTTDHGEYRFCSSVLMENVFAVQFHPEKSGAKGLLIYSAWASSINRPEYKID